ncbi:MAG: hypothetical protein ACLSX5_08345 [Lachnospiraceae bacterium]
MGRGGGRSGGSRGGFSRGGSRGFSSHRSSGAHRGGSSFGGSSYRSSRTSRSSRPPRPRGRVVRPMGPVFIPMTTVYRNSDRKSSNSPMDVQQGGAGSASNSGGISGWFKWLSGFVCVVIFMLLIFAGYTMSAAKDSPAREKLGPDACITSDKWIQDELGWIQDKHQVEQAMDYFYEKTGVQPYLLITDTLDGMGGDITDGQAETAMENMYESLYEDEGHMIFTFMEYDSSRYITWIYTGITADSVIDKDAREIFLNNADRYYTDSSLSDEEFFAKVFRTSADMIMKDSAKQAAIARMCVIISVLMGIGLAGGFLWFKAAEERRKETKELKEILETPIGSVTSPEEEELLRKYGTSPKEDN